MLPSTADLGPSSLISKVKLNTHLFCHFLGGRLGGGDWDLPVAPLFQKSQSPPLSQSPLETSLVKIQRCEFHRHSSEKPPNLPCFRYFTRSSFKTKSKFNDETRAKMFLHLFLQLNLLHKKSDFHFNVIKYNNV